MIYYVLPILVVLLIAYLFYKEKQQQKQRKTFFTNTFGHSPYSTSSLPKEVAAYHAYLQKSYPQHPYVDSTTWNDLSMDDVFTHINYCQTSPGEELLFAALHRNKKMEKEDSFEHLQSYLRNHPHQRLQIQLAFDSLHKHSSASIIDILDSPENFSPYKPFLVKVFSLLPYLCPFLFFFSSPMAITALALVGAINLAFYTFFDQKLQGKHLHLAYVNSFLLASKKVLSIQKNPSLPKKEEALQALKPFRPHLNIFTNPFIKLAAVNQSSSAPIDMLSKLFTQITLQPLRAYNKGTKLLQKGREELRFLYHYMGSLDMAISVLAYRSTLPYYCLPEYNPALSLYIKEGYHPLLPKGVSNSLEMNKGILLTGSNASGKSTFLKTLGVNMLLAQGIHTCCANSFTLPNIPLYTSMAIKDNLTKGESYFIAEIKSLKRMTDKLTLFPCFILIDEILRGTNSLERISASTSILQSFLSFPCLSVVATHDGELTHIFRSLYDLYHFKEKVTNQEVLFDYTLYPGPAKSKNALLLLEMLGFDSPVLLRANALATHYEENQLWLSSPTSP